MAETQCNITKQPWLKEKIHFAVIRRWLQYTGKKRALILLMHRTTSEKVWEEQYNNSPQYLRELFLAMKQRGFHFVSMDQVMSLKPLEQPAVTITFDDGFADNLYEVIPVLQELEIPYTLFPPVGNIRRENVTMEAMADYMMNHPEWKSHHVKREKTSEDNIQARETVINYVRNAKSLSQIRLEQKYFQQENGTDLKEEMNRLYLSGEQISELAKDPLCTIGAHAYQHVPMRILTDAELMINTVEAKHILEDITGKAVDYFAFPFGGFEDNYLREFNAVAEAGFRRGFMFYEGIYTDKFRDHHGYMIPRIQINSMITIQENIELYEKLGKAYLL